MLKPGAMQPVPVIVPADEWDNLVRKWGVGYCCEWFGHPYDGEFAAETVRILQERALATNPEPKA